MYTTLGLALGGGGGRPFGLWSGGCVPWCPGASRCGDPALRLPPGESSVVGRFNFSRLGFILYPWSFVVCVCVLYALLSRA